MSLKDRFNLKGKKEVVSKKISKEFISDDILKKIVNDSENILLCCPIDVKTSEAISIATEYVANNKRIVVVGENINVNKNEVIKFEPDYMNTSKNLIKIALDLDAKKIFLQNFYGAEALDIFKLINSDIKNIVSAVKASTPEKALSQVELNLYMSGINIPVTLMKTMITNCFKKIIVMNMYDGRCTVDSIYELKSIKNDNYILKNFIKKDEQPVVKQEIKGFEKNIIDTGFVDLDIEEAQKEERTVKRPKNILAKKIKHNKLST